MDTYFQTVYYMGSEYAQCKRCKGFGRPRWAHMCGKPGERSPYGNWHASPGALEQADAKSGQGG